MPKSEDITQHFKRQKLRSAHIDNTDDVKQTATFAFEEVDLAEQCQFAIAVIKRLAASPGLPPKQSLILHALAEGKTIAEIQAEKKIDLSDTDIGALLEVLAKQVEFAREAELKGSELIT